MPDIIALLPDNIANQIAAGEVIQRPASAVKELLENAIDAGATQIHLIIKDAGKELIQVIDNGKGMSATDARRSFERHATSKIKNIDDLFAIRTMGFRGEALASIAAVAQVELKTRQPDNETGTCIITDNSIIRSQEVCQAEPGTSISIKNLFFNVPARRNFLKSNTVEMRHIVDEFTRVAMANPDIAFRFTNNQSDLYRLERGKLKQRVIALLGNTVSNKLVPVEEPTDVVQISGFVATPDAANRTRGSQYFFVNNRYIKSAYLNHAVTQAYSDLLAKDEFPVFTLFIEIDPQRVDINVHPTKQEIKFEDERIIYSFVNAAVKHALSKYSVTPSLDFSLDAGIEQLPSVTQPFSERTKQQTKGDFLFQSFTDGGQAHFLNKKEDMRNWKELYSIQSQFGQAPKNLSLPNADDEPVNTSPEPLLQEEFKPSFLQINAAYIIASSKYGFLLIDQKLAHERILFERYQKAAQQPVSRQRCLHPQTFEWTAADAILLESILPELLLLGYEVESFGNNTFILQSIPADIPGGQEQQTLQKLLEDLKHESSDLKTDARENIIRAMARQMSISHGKKLNSFEMEKLVNDLFLCEQPQYSPSGKKILAKLNQREIEQLLQHA